MTLVVRVNFYHTLAAAKYNKDSKERIKNTKMNNEKNIFIHVVEANVSEDEIVLASPTELIEEANTIAQNTKSDEKFPFALQYDVNQKDFLLSMLITIGAIVENDDEDAHLLTTMINMTQLAFIKQLCCVERVKTDEGINPFLAEEAVELTSIQQEQQEDEALDDEVQVVVADIDPETLEVQTEIALNRTTDAELEAIAIAETEQADGDIAVASVAATARSSCCPCPTNVSMETAATISDESYTSGYICCPGAEQWFKFVATRTGRYTICTTGSLDTIGTLYDCCGNQITRVDDYAPCGKINFRIICNLTDGNTYYVKVGISKGNVGSYTLRVTERVFANYVNINKTTITLEKGVTYELPITSNYTYKGYNGAQRIPGLSVSISPSNANEQKIWWWEQYGSVLECSYGWDDDGDRYIHVTATEKGTAKLYAQDWNENGKRDECTVYVGGYPVTGIELDFTNKTMHIGENDYLWEKITPSGALNLNVDWSSNNPSVAEVDPAGKVYAKSIGTAIITARTVDGGYTAKCTISVVEGIIVEKTDANHNRIVFPNGKVWNCVNFDIINDYNLDQDDPESQRFYDNVYETKVYDEPTEHTYYYEPFKEYSDEELKIIYMIDPHGMAAYVREYASALPDTGDGVQTMLSKILAYKDRIFRMLFGRSPRYYKRNTLGRWYRTTDTSDWTDVVSESECLFGGHPIYDGKFWLEFFTIILDIVTMVLPSLGLSEKIVKKVLKTITYYSLLRSVSQSVLDEDFNGFLSAIANGLADEEQLEEIIIINGKPHKAANYTLGWAFSMLSFSSDLGVLADTFNAGPHFYKEVFTQCSSDTDYDVYLRVADGNLVSVSNLADILD